MASIPWWMTVLDETEADAVRSAVLARRISQGPVSQQLADEIAETLGVKHALCVPSGSMGLMLTMLALGIGPGDEVIVPDLTWIATAHGASLLGANIILVDTLEDQPLMDPAKIENAITDKTKAIIPVHLAGRAVDMASVTQIAKKHNIPVIEDAAQALSSKGKDGYLGTIGDMGVFSLGLAKLIATGQGGVVVCKDDALFEKLKTCTFHGTDHIPAETYLMPGMNMKFPDTLASIGLIQWGRLQDKQEHVRRIYTTYQKGLRRHNHMVVQPCDLDGGELPLWTEIRTPHRDNVKKFLASHNIESRLPHRPLHEARHLFSGNGESFPNAKQLTDELLILPSGPNQPIGNVEKVIEILQQFDGTGE